MSKLPVCPCELSLIAKSPKLLYRGASQPKVLIVGTAPSLQDDKTGQLFSGQDGTDIRKLLKKVGVDSKEVGYTNVISCHYEKRPKAEHIRCCNQNLQKTIKLHSKQLELIILVGSVATKALLGKTGMDNLVGKVHRIAGTYVLPMHEPSKKQSEAKKKQEVRDLQKALALTRLDVNKLFDWEIVDAKRLEELKPELINAKVLTFDCETSGLEMTDSTQFIIGVGFCYNTKKRKGCFVPLEHYDSHISKKEYDRRIELLREIFLSEVPLRAFNGGFDLSWIHQFLDVNIDSVNYVSDTMHGFHLVRDSKDSMKLENIVLADLPEFAGYDAEIDIYKVKYDKQFAFFPLDKIARYCVGDAVATAILAEEQIEKKIKKQGSWNLYRNIIVPVTPIYDKISMNGINLDFDYCKKMEREYAKQVEYLANKCYKSKIVQKYYPSIDVSKGAQVKHLLYDKLKLPKQYNKDRGNLSVDKVAISNLLQLDVINEDIIEFLKNYKDYCVVLTVNQRYASKWSNWVGEDGLVHPSYMLSGTVTGRLACQNPNFAQLSRNQADTNEMTDGERFMLKWPVRRMLVSRFPNGKLVSCDYSQLELRVAGMLSNDKIMVGTYRDNLYSGDLHTAKAVQNHPDYFEQNKSTQKEWRRDAKVDNFGGIYSLNDDFLSSYPQLKEYVEKTKGQIRAHGRIETIYGRVRKLPLARLPYPDGVDKWKMSKEEKSNFYTVQSELRKGVNFTIQAPAHTTMEKAIIRINRRMVKEKVKSPLILEVHDDLIADCIPEEIEQVGRILQEEMEGVTEELDWTNGVPLVAEPESGWSWDSKKPLVFST